MACDLGASAQPVKSFVLYNYPRSIENEARLHCSPSIRCATRHMATLAWLFLFLCGFQQQPGMCGFVFRFQLKSLGEEHKWRSKTKAEREGNHCSMYEQTTKSLDHEISGCFWDYFGAFKSVNLGIQGTMIFHKYKVHFLNWKSKCLNYIQQGSHQTRWSHGCLNSPISFLPSVFFLWRSSNHQAQASTWHGEHRWRTQPSLSSWDVRGIRRC